MRPPATPSEVALRYALFAGIAIASNLLAQAASLSLYRGPFAIAAAIAAGTVVGLLVKFQLDRRLIFYAPPASVASGTFLSYAGTGAFTTIIFWGTETLAYLASGRKLWALYAGGLVGLIIGNAVKYRLDKRFVFGARRSETAK